MILNLFTIFARLLLRSFHAPLHCFKGTDGRRLAPRVLHRRTCGGVSPRGTVGIHLPAASICLGGSDERA
jgi:hypothetical protein